MRLKPTWTISVLATAAAMTVPASASAETTTIGSSLANGHNFDFAHGGCPPRCTAAQRHHSPAAHPLVAPVNGLVTQWSVRTGQVGATYRLRILRPAGSFFFCVSPSAPNAPPNYCPYAFAGSSPITPPVPDAMDLIRGYTGSVPINEGDAIGLESVSGPGVPLHAVLGDLFTHGPGLFAYSPSAADGSSHLFGTAHGEVLLQATISFCRVPGVLGQAEAAATAAVGAADCTAAVNKQQLRLKRIKKSLSKKKKKAAIRAENRKLQAQDGIVLGQSIAPGTTQATSTPVGLTIGDAVAPPKPKKKKKEKT